MGIHTGYNTEPDPNSQARKTQISAVVSGVLYWLAISDDNSDDDDDDQLPSYFPQ